jgi:hypothetical protein
VASSSEAFAKLSTWKKLRTSLRVTLIESGKTKEVLSGWIDAVDANASLVSISWAIRESARFDVEDSVFSVEPTRVVVTRNESDWLVFEESSN